MFHGRTVEARLEKLERSMIAMHQEAQAARNSFMMTVGQMDKLKHYAESHVHTMVDDHGKGTTRPQHEVIEIIHELVQVLESEANTLRVDTNASREATAQLNQRLSDLEASVVRLCRSMQVAFDPTKVFGTSPDS